ncbi:uncharacterized protein TA03580 [Theileria annulata]|uniref:Uncharacterized protein n=1 Tax=Theileria annulata TaxID=5874 RepID=Q4UCI1_THEAN|nr:uncharacterized protein TA03580 [Theileria annulata]CAI75470.2 hypothetical protein TA03580 [Theileria annulata]|eukprot:XP_954946.1 hypothetical protein TA03580 [Theileria annulata]
MAYSQASDCSLGPTRFYDDLESASEGFFHKSCLVQKIKYEKEKNFEKNRCNVYNAVRQLLTCCFGTKQGSNVPNFTIMGKILDNMYKTMLRYDFNDLFEDSSTIAPSTEGSDDMIGYRRNDVLWAIEPSKRLKYIEISLPEAKWLVLSWSSKITNGENINKNLLDSIINECKLKSQSISYLTPNVIKNFPGLYLCENLYEMESNDFIVGLDNLMSTLQSYIQPDSSTFVLIIHKAVLYSLYYTSQGSVDYIVLFEIKLFERGDIHYFARFLAFQDLGDVRRYLMTSRNIQVQSKLRFYLFNFKKLKANWTLEEVGQKEQPEKSSFYHF